MIRSFCPGRISFSPFSATVRCHRITGPAFFMTMVTLVLILRLSLEGFAGASGDLTIAGNGPEQTTIEALARAFEKLNPRAYIDIDWDEHSRPIEMVKADHAHLAVTGSEDPALISTQIGWDGIGILIHLSNFTKELSRHQVADIFTGKTRNWAELGGPDATILLIDRPANQNIREAFESYLGIKGKISDTAKMIGSDEVVVKTVVGTLPPRSATTFLSLSTGLSAVSSGVAVRLVAVDKVEPEAPTVKDGRYGLRRPLLILSRREANPLAEAFLQFTLSAQGQSIIGETYIPLSNR